MNKVILAVILGFLLLSTPVYATGRTIRIEAGEEEEPDGFLERLAEFYKEYQGLFVAVGLMATYIIGFAGGVIHEQNRQKMAKDVERCNQERQES